MLRFKRKTLSIILFNFHFKNETLAQAHVMGFLFAEWIGMLR